MPKPLPVIVTRADAYAKGYKTFYTGNPCKRGHLAPRYVATGACLECLTVYKGQGAKNPFNADLVPYAPRNVWRPKHWDAATLERFHVAVQTFIDTWEEAPPAPESVQANKFRMIYGERYFSASSIKDVNGVEHDLWFTFNNKPRQQLYLKESHGNAPPFPVFNEEALGDIPWLLLGDRWCALKAAEGKTVPVVLDEHLSLMLNRYGDNG